MNGKMSVDEGFLVLVCCAILAFVTMHATLQPIPVVASMLLVALLGAIIGFCWAVALMAAAAVQEP